MRNLPRKPDTSLREKSHYLERANDWAFKWLTKMRGQNNNSPKDLSQLDLGYQLSVGPLKCRLNLLPGPGRNPPILEEV